MRWLLNLLVLCCVPLMAVADEPMVIRAKAALALSQASREREATAQADARQCTADYALATLRAAKSGRPLILWVGMNCEDSPTVRATLPDAVHCHLKEFNGDASPRVVFPGIDGRSWQFARAQLGEDAAQMIREKAGLPPAPKERYLP